jgi:hypothetical protein
VFPPLPPLARRIHPPTSPRHQVPPPSPEE